MNLFQFLEQLQAYQLQTGPDSWERFEQSTMWQDMVNRMTVDLLNRYESVESTEEDDLHAIGVIQGNIECIKRYMEFPRTLANEAIQQAENME